MEDKIKFYARIKTYFWNGTTVSDCCELKAKTQEKAQKEAEKKVKKLNDKELQIFELECVFSEVDE